MHIGLKSKMEKLLDLRRMIFFGKFRASGFQGCRESLCKYHRAFQFEKILLELLVRFQAIPMGSRNYRNLKFNNVIVESKSQNKSFANAAFVIIYPL